MQSCWRGGKRVARGEHFCPFCGTSGSGHSNPNSSRSSSRARQSLPAWVPRGTRRSGRLALAALVLVVIVIALTAGCDYGPSKVTPVDDARKLLLRRVQLDFTWERSGFDSVMIANFSLKNPTSMRFRDFQITCRHSGSSGTEIDSNTRTIYEIVEAHSTKYVSQVNMGFIHSQAAASRCSLTDLVPLSSPKPSDSGTDPL